MCTGCVIDLSEERVGLRHDETVAIEWNPALFRSKLFNLRECVAIKQHASVQTARLHMNKPVRSAAARRRGRQGKARQGKGGRA
jgi:hypothetical protein